jgi:hypothetical protein
MNDYSVVMIAWKSVYLASSRALSTMNEQLILNKFLRDTFIYFKCEQLLIRVEDKLLWI